LGAFEPFELVLWGKFGLKKGTPYPKKHGLHLVFIGVAESKDDFI
jgi:hypothetical protein